jgi:hypothetical protein
MRRQYINDAAFGFDIHPSVQAAATAKRERVYGTFV